KVLEMGLRTSQSLVEEIYQAQRDRDQAVMARLRLANEERDEALLRAKHLQQPIVAELEIVCGCVCQDLEELLNRVNNADSALGIDRSGAVIVDRLQKARERRKKIIAEEMNAVIEERDNALARCQRLEQDLVQAREQSQTSANNSRHLTAENNQELVLKAIRRERDRALERSQQLEEEIQTLRAFIPHTLPSSMPPSLPLFFCPPYFSPLVSKSPPPPQHLGFQAHSAFSHVFRSLTLVSLSWRRLERLVEVLRKKVGTGSVRTVI
uniref:Mirror-image polydactyly 1 n=1 Tax=Esox lucius TaxID=8010 RepID=A0AAY5KUW6_ESOLU